jgi:hypothetical protein
VKPGLATIKRLFALSCNRCAFPECDRRLTEPHWQGVGADIAHIRGESPGAARYAPDMSEADRNSVDNLMLLCPNHHRLIDRLEPHEWSAETLMQMKLDHEERCDNRDWATDSQLEHFASTLASMEAEGSPPSPSVPPPRLAIEKGPQQAYEVVNVGNADAFEVSVEAAPNSPDAGGLIWMEEGPLAKLSPGGRWRAIIYSSAMSSQGRPVLRVTWKDADGTAYEGDFPL